jgi:hypothetical protein
MGKRDRGTKDEKKAKGSQKAAKATPKSSDVPASQLPHVSSSEKHVDPALASLFALSVIPQSRGFVLHD